MRSHDSRRPWFLVLVVLLGISCLVACGKSGPAGDGEPEGTPTLAARASTPEATVVQFLTTTSPRLAEPQPTSTPTAEPTDTPEPTTTPLPPRVDKWMGNLIIELEEKKERDDVAYTSFADTVTYDFSFIVLRGEIKGKGTGHRNPDFAPGDDQAEFEEIECPDLSVTVKGTGDTSAVYIQLLDRAPLPQCSATVVRPSGRDYVGYGPHLVVVLADLVLELPLRDGGVGAGADTLDPDHLPEVELWSTMAITEITPAEFFGVVNPLVYTYTATIELANP